MTILFRSPVAESAPPCSCHGQPVAHEILANGAIHIVQATVTVRSKTEPKEQTLSLTPSGLLQLGSIWTANLKDLTFAFVAEDPDSDVCEPGIQDISAFLIPKSDEPPVLKISFFSDESQPEFSWIPFQQKQGGWQAVCKSPWMPGTYTFEFGGTLQDKYDDHPDSDDPDFVIPGCKSEITINQGDCDLVGFDAVTGKEVGEGVEETSGVLLQPDSVSVPAVLILRPPGANGFQRVITFSDYTKVRVIGPNGQEITDEKSFGGNDPISLTVFQKGEWNPTNSVTATLSIIKGGQDVGIAPDVVRLVIIETSLVAVQIDEYGDPVVVGGEAQAGDEIDLENEGLCTYAPSPGDNRGELTREITLDGGAQWVTIDVGGDTADLIMTYGGKELFTSWSLTKIPGTELYDRYEFVGEPNRLVIADLYHANPPAATTQLKVRLKDEEFTGSPNEFDLSYHVFLPDSGSGFYSNYRMTGPGDDIGYPPFSDRNMVMLKVSAGGADLDFGSELSAQAEDDSGLHPLTMSKRDDGAYYSEVMVPVLQVDAGKDLGLEGSVPGVKVLKFQTADPKFVKCKFHIWDNVMNSISKLEANVDQAMLISALMTDEYLSRGTAVSEPGRNAVEKLGLGVTPLFQPTKPDIKEQLKSHRMWIHSGHGHFEDGISILKKAGTRYKIDTLKPADIGGLGVTYRLVFMNTCQSTDRYYTLNEATWVAQPDPTLHKVRDLGATLHAQNYVGWDCSVSRGLSIKIPKLLTQYLNGEGESWTRRDVAQAVADLRQLVLDNPGTYEDSLYAPRLRAVLSDGSKFDWNKQH